MAGGGGLRGQHPNGNARLMRGSHYPLAALQSAPTSHVKPTAWRSRQPTIHRLRHPVSLRGGENPGFRRRECGHFPRLRSEARLCAHSGSNERAAPTLAMILRPKDCRAILAQVMPAPASRRRAILTFPGSPSRRRANSSAAQPCCSNARESQTKPKPRGLYRSLCRKRGFNARKSKI